MKSYCLKQPQFRKNRQQLKLIRKNIEHQRKKISQLVRFNFHHCSLQQLSSQSRQPFLDRKIHLPLGNKEKKTKLNRVNIKQKVKDRGVTNVKSKIQRMQKKIYLQEQQQESSGKSCTSNVIRNFL